jgi:hypothetical protein
VLASGIPYYSTTWNGFGQVVERMRELVFGTSFASFSPKSWDVSFIRNYKVKRVLQESLPRAVSIAAILAVQGAEP